MRRALVIAIVALAGCAAINPGFIGSGRAEERKWEPGKGGVIALKGVREKAQIQAEQFMAERCGAGQYRITAEEEAAWREPVLGGATIELRLTYVCEAPAHPGPAATSTAPATASK